MTFRARSSCSNQTLINEAAFSDGLIDRAARSGNLAAQELTGLDFLEWLGALRNALRSLETSPKLPEKGEKGEFGELESPGGCARPQGKYLRGIFKGCVTVNQTQLSYCYLCLSEIQDGP